MKWIGYIGSFLAGVLLTGGAYEVAGMLDSVAVLAQGPTATEAAAPAGHRGASARAGAPREPTHAGSPVRARLTKRIPTALVAAGPHPVVPVELEQKIATLTPEEKAAIKERRKARKAENRRVRKVPVRAAGEPPVGDAPPAPATDLDTGTPAAE